MARLLASQLSERRPDNLVLAVEERGKPFWRNVDCPFSISHSGAWVFLAIGGHAPLGVDIQAEQDRIDVDGIAEFALSPEEQAALAACSLDQRRRLFFTLWVLREAALKATGQGVFDLSRTVSALPVPPCDQWCQAPSLGTTGIWLRILDAPDGYQAALAVLNPDEQPAHPEMKTWADAQKLLVLACNDAHLAE